MFNAAMTASSSSPTTIPTSILPILQQQQNSNNNEKKTKNVKRLSFLRNKIHITTARIIGKFLFYMQQQQRIHSNTNNPKCILSILLVGVLLVLTCLYYGMHVFIHDDMGLTMSIRTITSRDIQSQYLSKSNNIDILFQEKSKYASRNECQVDSSTKVEFTLVTQLSYDRLWMLPYQCLRWGYNSPMSIVILLPNTNNATSYKSSMEEIHRQIQPNCNANVLSLQLVTLSNEIDVTEYPINYLRNLALAQVKTSHVLYIDIDFWISDNLYATLHSSSIRTDFTLDEKLVLVIPALSIPRMCREYRDCPEDNIPQMPNTKQDVTHLFHENKVSPFDPTNYGGHGSTLYNAWFKSTTEGELIDIPCIKSNRYEPYLAFQYCHDTPPFQNIFTGYGKNKMTWAMQLRYLGYKFTQLNGVFVVHYPHLDSKSRISWNEGTKQSPENTKRAKNDEIFLLFRKWLKRIYGEDMVRTKLCEERGDDDARLWIERD